MLVDPRVVRRHVVRDKIEHQLQAALLEPLAQAGKRSGAAQSDVDGVALDSKARTGDVFFS
jgi:hypothetical protein